MGDDADDALLLVLDQYEVTSWDELAAALEMQPNVVGSYEQGWTVLEAGSPGKLLVVLRRDKAGGLEVSAASIKKADIGSSWLRQVAANVLDYKGRVTVDPDMVLLAGAESKEGLTELRSEVRGALFRQWSGEPKAGLGNLTPRQAMESQDGRALLIDLLKSYDLEEKRSAREAGREPVSFEFLWRELGLARDEGG